MNTLKSCGTFFLILSFLLLVGCEKKEPTPVKGITAADFVGTWTLVSTDWQCTVNPDNFSEAYGCPPEENKPCHKVTFKTNGKFEWQYSYVANGEIKTVIAEEGTYTITKDTMAWVPSAPGADPYAFKFVFSGNDLTLIEDWSSSDDTCTYARTYVKS